MTSAHRTIVNTDAKNEADDQYAIVHALLSPTLDVRGIIPAHFGDRRSKTSMEDSRAEVDLLLRLLGMEGKVRVENGAPRALPDERTPVPSPGSRLIVEESLAEADGRLFITFLGPLTDMASALLEEPSIQHRDITVVWIGGPPYGGILPAHPMEFNLSNDIASANVVFDSDVEVWQIPMNVYTKVAVGYAELEERVRPCGDLGDYLVRQLLEFNETVDSPMEFRSLGDSPAIGAVMNPYGSTWREYPRPRFDADGWMTDGKGTGVVRVCESMDIRWLLEDMFAKLRRFSA